MRTPVARLAIRLVLTPGRSDAMLSLMKRKPIVVVALCLALAVFGVVVSQRSAAASRAAEYEAALQRARMWSDAQDAESAASKQRVAAMKAETARLEAASRTR